MPSDTALQEQMFVSFEETTNSVLSVASELVGI